MIAKELVDHDLLEDSKLQLGDSFQTIVNYFFEDAVGYLNEIRNAIANNKPINAVAAAHTIKSSSLIIGAVRVSSLAREIEQVARDLASQNQSAAPLQELYNNLEAAIMETKKELLH